MPVETKIKKTITPDKISIIDQDRMMQRIVAEEKVKLNELRSERENLSMKISQLNQDLSRNQAQFEQWKRGEEQKLDQKKFNLNNEIILREKKLEVAELDMSRRQEEMARREKIGIAIMEKQAKLNNDRIEFEKLRSSASLQMENADRKMSEASSLFSQASEMMIRAKEVEKRANAINDTIVKREHAVSEKEKEVSLSFNNLEEVKKIVDPKLQEIKSIEEKIEANKKALIEKESAIEAKIIEEKTLLRDLEIKQKKLADKEKELNQREEDMVRKNLIGLGDAK